MRGEKFGLQKEIQKIYERKGMIEAMKYMKWITVLFCLLGLAACRQDAPRFRIAVAHAAEVELADVTSSKVVMTLGGTR